MKKKKKKDLIVIKKNEVPGLNPLYESKPPIEEYQVILLHKMIDPNKNETWNIDDPIIVRAIVSDMDRSIEGYKVFLVNKLFEQLKQCIMQEFEKWCRT